MRITNVEGLNRIKEKGLRKLIPPFTRIAVGMGTCGLGNNAGQVYSALEREIKKQSLKAYLTKTGCFGFCAGEPLVTVYSPGSPILILNKVKASDAAKIISSIKQGQLSKLRPLCKIEAWDHLTFEIVYNEGYPKVPSWDSIPFFKGQKKIVLRDCGLINPDDIEEYIAVGGYSSLYKVLREFSPETALAEIKKSNLRGRGGAGFPVWKKWEILKSKRSQKKYIVCNADEGDPGAYMNRNELESDPHMVLEGMIIGACITGASEGIIYCRAEYPLAVERLSKAIEQAKKYGLLGDNIFGTGFSFSLHVVEGAGAFVCGEETALIASIEGKAGRPVIRPPFPAEKGLWGRPTNINNVETFSNIPVIIAKGGDWFSRIGIKTSTGTKVFSLVGKVRNTGLVELPLGTNLRTLVYDIGGGTGTRKKVKAVQSGGPSGGCIPSRLFDRSIDYESLASLGAIMGSGGMVVMDEDNCMVDVACYFTEFTTSESCGKCVPCREGVPQLLKILKDITRGRADIDSLNRLKELGKVIKDTALCGLGQTAPNPVLTTLSYFEEEYLKHIKEKNCIAGVCQDLFVAPCENSCPLHMNIPGYLQLVKEKKLEQAFDLVIRENPLAASIGRICHFHCNLRCRREDIDEPVAQGEVHRYIADTIYKKGKETELLKRLVKEKLPLNGMNISIIGAGPAGLTAAYYLTRLGYQVTVYDRHSLPGGILRWGIPSYRLPRQVLAREIGFIRKLGVKFVLGETVTPARIKRLRKESRAVILAMGAYSEISPGIPGEKGPGVIPGIEFLESLAREKMPVVGSRVVIIGGGNVAIDVARSALRLGIGVTVAYRRQKQYMPANESEIADAVSEGVKFKFLAAPEKIFRDSRNRVKGITLMKMIPGDYDLSGRPRPRPTGKTEDIPCDTVILAVGERVDRGFLEKAGIKINKSKTAEVCPYTLETGLPGIYAIGDIVTGPGTAVKAMAQGRKVAEVIDKRIFSKDRFACLFREVFYKDEVPEKPEGGKRNRPSKIDVKRRVNNFNEVSRGLTQRQVFNECRRCLRCDVR